MPTFEGHPGPPAQASGGAQPSGPGLPPLTPADRTKFTRIFVSCGPQNGLVSGDKAREVFLKSQLNYDKLGQIWCVIGESYPDCSQEPCRHSTTRQPGLDRFHCGNVSDPKLYGRLFVKPPTHTPRWNLRSGVRRSTAHPVGINQPHGPSAHWRQHEFAGPSPAHGQHGAKATAHRAEHEQCPSTSILHTRFLAVYIVLCKRGSQLGRDCGGEIKFGSILCPARHAKSRGHRRRCGCTVHAAESIGRGITGQHMVSLGAIPSDLAGTSSTFAMKASSPETSLRLQCISSMPNSLDRTFLRRYRRLWCPPPYARLSTLKRLSLAPAMPPKICSTSLTTIHLHRHRWHRTRLRPRLSPLRALFCLSFLLAGVQTSLHSLPDRYLVLRLLPVSSGPPRPNPLHVRQPCPLYRADSS